MGGEPFKNTEGVGVGLKNYECQFQFLDPPKHMHANNFGGIKSF